MELLIEIIIEFIATVFIDNTDSIVENKKISKFIRYPIIFIVILLSIILTVGPIILGIFLLNKNVIGAIISIFIGLLNLTGIVFYIKKVIKEKNSQINRGRRTMEENNSKKTNTSVGNIGIVSSILLIVTSLLLIFVYDKVAIGVCFIVVGFSTLGVNIEEKKKKNKNKEK